MDSAQIQKNVLPSFAQESAQVKKLATEISKVVVGNQETIDFMLVALLCNGHVLLEGVPGVAKTTMVKAVAQALGLSFKRIQFTPDLLPSDLIGTLIYNQKTYEFETKKGPIFAHMVLADEINRSPAKVQSALLEAMQEHQVTIGNDTYVLEEPFLVFATQNPQEQEGVYRLPEAQVDRFLFKLLVDYPTMAQEKRIVTRATLHGGLDTIMGREEICAMQRLVKNVYVDEKIVDYLVHLVFATRTPGKYALDDVKEYIACGASPRATIALYQAAQAYAFLQDRSFVIPDDIKKIAYPILRHRLTLTYQADVQKITPDEIVAKIIARIQAP